MHEKSLRERISAAHEAALRDTAAHPDIVRWRSASIDDVDAIHSVAVAADTIDHPHWITPREDIADTFDLPHIDPARDWMLAIDSSDAVVAYGSVSLHPARSGTLTVHVDGAVHPRLRRRGIGTQLLARQRARGLERLEEAIIALPGVDLADWQADLKLYAEEANLDHQAIAARAGLSAERWFTSMERDMSVPFPVSQPREDVRIVPYTHDRDDDAREARNDAFRDHWGSQPSQPEGWRKFVGGSFFRPDLSRLAVDGEGHIVGFCLASVNEDDWAALGATHSYIDLIGVVRAHRRKGLAPAVVAATLRAIAEAGLERAVLDVDTASPTGANALYEGLGFVATERTVAFVQRL